MSNIQITYEVPESEGQKFFQSGPNSSYRNPRVRFNLVNHDTLDRYTAEAQVNHDIIPKLQSWIQKGKYHCVEATEERMRLQLNIIDLTFTKVVKSTSEKIAEQMKILDSQHLCLKKEMSLFNLLFFINFKSQEQRGAPYGQHMGFGQFHMMNPQFQLPSTSAAPMPQSGAPYSIDTQFHKIKCVGEVTEEEEAQESSIVASNKVGSVALKFFEQLPDEVARLNMNNQGAKSRQFEALLLTPDEKMILVKVYKERYNRKILVDHEEVFHSVESTEDAIVKDQEYELFIPRAV